MPLVLPTDTEHPDALREGLSIAAASLPHLHAIGQLSGVLDKLFDGPNSPPYVGASRQASQVFGPATSVSDPTVLSRIFWDSSTEGIAACIHMSGTRPILMSVVAFGLPGVNPPVGEVQAMHQAEIRAVSRIPDV